MHRIEEVGAVADRDHQGGGPVVEGLDERVCKGLCVLWTDLDGAVCAHD